MKQARFESRPYPFRQGTGGQPYDPALHQRFTTANTAIADIVEHLSQVVSTSQASEDVTAQLVWLDDRASGDGDQWGLCSSHAGRLRVPNGWSAVDRRVARRPRPASLAS